MFADTERETFKKRKVEYLDLGAGPTKLRILDSHAPKYYTHFVSGISIACLDDDCPICEMNRELILKDGKNFRSNPNYVQRTKRYYVNVLDKTPTKVCPKCGNAVKLDVPACTECATLLTQVEKKPLNKVKILAKGVTLFDQINSIDANIQDASGQKIGINKYDLTIITSGSGKSVTYTVIPDTSSGVFEEEKVNPEDLFDVESCVIKLTPEEILDLQRGVKLKEIFMLRKAEETEETHVQAELPEMTTPLSQEQLDDLNSRIDTLFNKE